MKDIASEAILFDMYYAAQDPVVLAGEKREAPKVQMLAVTEQTPQFKNFYVSNIVCDGSEKAVFIRGLPEMPIKNIHLDNLTIRARKGIEISEASDVAFNNMRLFTSDTKPVADIANSRNISFGKVDFPVASDVLFRISGERSSDISVANSNMNSPKQKVEFAAGAGENSFITN